MSESTESAERKENFTPGPWTSVHDCDDEYYIEVTSRFSGHKCQLGSGSFDNANAFLIAAAPDMYAALVKAVKDYGKPGGPWNVPSEPGTWIHSATSALAKARGES